MKQSNSNSNAAGALAGWLAIFALNLSIEAKTPVELPAGSIDALAAAVAAAGPGGTVRVKSGLHHESGVVIVTIPITIVGEPGASIECNTVPGEVVDLIPINPTLHVIGAAPVTVKGLEFHPLGPDGGCAMVLEDSPGAQILNNTTTYFRMGVVLQHSDHALVSGNVITADRSVVPSIGILDLNGRFARFTDNIVANAFFGIFGSDHDGHITDNEVSGCWVGVLLCHATGLILAGNEVNSSTPATGWKVEGNLSHDNTWAGYQVIDGANNNLLVNNAAFGNGEYDIELVGPTMRYGVSAPTSYNNLVVVGSRSELVVKDCGQNNTIKGKFILEDNITDPCF